jgi:hypothetical protein
MSPVFTAESFENLDFLPVVFPVMRLELLDGEVMAVGILLFIEVSAACSDHKVVLYYLSAPEVVVCRMY